MKQPAAWIAAALMLTGAVLLLTGVGSTGVWTAVITIGIAVVALDAYRRRQAHRL